MATATKPTAEEMRATWNALAAALGWRLMTAATARHWAQSTDAPRHFREGVAYARQNGAAERCPQELAAVEELLTRA